MTSLIAFQGEPGAYSEAALLAFFGADAQPMPCESFEDVFAAVRSGGAAAGMIPIENSLAGSIHQNYDLLLRGGVWITGELALRVHHCLLAPRGVALAAIDTVISHPQALAQCAGYLRANNLRAQVFYDTAGAAKQLSLVSTAGLGAIASRRAAEVYQLDVLAEGIEDNPANFTRFLSIAREPAPIAPDEEAQAKTTIVFTLNSQPGALFKALSVFALRDIDLSKIESRPLVGHPWEYLFYIDVAGAAGSGPLARALDHLGEYATSLRVLGSYPRDPNPTAV